MTRLAFTIFCILFSTFSAFALDLDGNYKGIKISGSSTLPDSCLGNSSQNYTVTFNMTWDSTTHPYDFPPDPHFSNPVGGMHNANYQMWEPGQLASVGMEDMAEHGNGFTLRDEIDAEILLGNAASSFLHPVGFDSPGGVTLNITATPQHPRLSTVTMLAPSPDWFVGVHDYNLCQNNRWVAYEEITLFAYDSGTDSATVYIDFDDDTDPADPIFLIETLPFLVNSTVEPVGTLVIERQ